ncbi:MAG: hypothetical protein ACFFCC_19905, partial [Promethearchaeota archaeon]
PVVCTRNAGRAVFEVWRLAKIRKSGLSSLLSNFRSFKKIKGSLVSPKNIPLSLDLVSNLIIGFSCQMKFVSLLSVIFSRFSLIFIEALSSVDVIIRNWIIIHLIVFSCTALIYFKILEIL